MLATLLFLTALMAGVLNLDSAFVRDVFLWPRLAIPASIIVGIFGVIQKGRVLSLITAIIAWIGISFFFLVAIVTVLPGELIRATDNPHYPSENFLVARFALLLSLGFLVAILFYKLKRATGTGKADARGADIRASK
jgi:hypothetical protein